MTDNRQINERGDSESAKADAGIVRDVIQILRGTIPLLDRIKRAIEESAGKIPKASKQLNNVTEATETATVEILNVLEAMTQRLSSIESGIQQLQRRSADRARAVEDILARWPVLGPDSENLPTMKRLLEEFKTAMTEDDTFPTLERHLKETKDDSVNIAIALQVQDITTQQIAGVTHLIESVQTKLGLALDHFDHPERQLRAVTKEKDAAKGSEQPPAQAFDIEAVYTKSTDRQNDADQIVKQWTQDGGT
jgi:chemotaxis regulatin CheY-phosphate phosphatase CheZ